MSVSKLMTRPVVSVEPDDVLRTVKEIFDNTHFHQLLVTDNGRLVGIISDRDLFKSVSHRLGTMAETTHDLTTLDRRVHQVMSRKVHALNPEDSVHDAVALIVEHNVSFVPVVDSNNRPVGILTWRDIMRELMRISRQRSRN